MGRVVGEVKKERTIILGCGFGYKLDRPIGERVRCVEVVGRVKRLIVEGQSAVAVGSKIVEGAAESAKVAIESPLQRPSIAVVAANVPFSGHQRVVPGWTQHLGERHALTIQEALVGSLDSQRLIGRRRHVADSGLVRMKPRQQTRSCGAAAAGVVELGESQSVARELIDVGRLDLASITTQVRESHVVHEDHDNVRTCFIGQGSGRAAERVKQGEASGKSQHDRGISRAVCEDGGTVSAHVHLNTARLSQLPCPASGHSSSSSDRRFAQFWNEAGASGFWSTRLLNRRARSGDQAVLLMTSAIPDATRGDNVRSISSQPSSVSRPRYA